MLMMIDAFLPEGVTELAVDSIFMTPQLGVLSTVHEQAATQVFERDCLVMLGPCVAPVGSAKVGQPCVAVEVTRADGTIARHSALFGGITLIPIPEGERVTLNVNPERSFDVGAGRGKPVSHSVRGGVVGMVIDTRGRRPFVLPEDAAKRIELLREWNRALSLYPREV